MSSLEMILILALFLNFSSDSHSLQEESTPTSLNAIQHLHEPMTFSHYPLDTENGTESSPPEAPVLSSVEEFCSAKVMDSIGLVYHVGSHLLLSVAQEPNGSVLGNQTNDTVKQWFYVYKWKTGDLYHRMVGLDEIFVMPDALKPNGPLMFATSLCARAETCTQTSQLVMATFSTATSSLESHTCLDLTSMDPILPSNRFLSTRMFRVANSTTTEGVSLPKLSLYPTVLELMPLRGRIGFGGGILIREELACPRIGFSRNSTNSTVQYASGFALPDLLILQAKPGFVQIGPNGTEMPISELLNCPFFLEPNSSSSLVFSNELKLVPVAKTEDTPTSVKQNPEQGFSILRELSNVFKVVFYQYPFIAIPILALVPLCLITPCCMRFCEEIFDDYSDQIYFPYAEAPPERIQYVDEL